MIHISWVNSNKTVICLDYQHPIADWDEYRSANHRAYEMMQTVSHTVHLIHHAGDVMMPSGNPFLHLRYVYNTLPDNTGQVVMVISHRFPRSVLNLLIKVTSNTDRFHMVKTIDEACDILNIDTDSI